MELAEVKARVKAWEKAFRAQQGREPTKDDIKRDDSDIAEQYALYRRLSKSAAAKGKSSASTSASSSSRPASDSFDGAAPDVTRTPSRRRLPPPPTTPTPSASTIKRPGTDSVAPPIAAPNFLSSTAEAGPSRPKRCAADLSPTTPLEAAATTPKRPKPGNTGGSAAHDPNPFSVTPRKGGASAAKVFGGSEVDSPFIHAGSPRRLREMLQSNSLRASLAREAGTAGGVEITPRTRARKRLAGEEVEATPAKAPRRRRGDRPSTTKDAFPDALPMAKFGGLDHADDDDDDGLGETPIKPGSLAFTLLDDGSGGKGRGRSNGATINGARNGTTSGKGIDLFPIFQRAKRAAAADPRPDPLSSMRRISSSSSNDTNNKRESAATVIHSSPTPEPTRSLPDAFSEESDIDPSADTDADVSASAAPSDGDAPTPTSPSSGAAAAQPGTPPDVSESPSAAPPLPTGSQRTPRRRVRMVAISEEDEWDPEGDTRMVRVTGTRRAAIKVRPDAGVASDDDMAGDAEEEDDDGDDENDDDDDDTGAAADLEDTDTDGATGAPMGHASGLLSLLSLRSPIARRGERLADLRVRALLDPTSAAAAMLRAQKRGQDVYVSGEADGEAGGDGDDDVWMEGGRGGVGNADDDWESDPEGWKAEPEEEEW